MDCGRDDIDVAWDDSELCILYSTRRDFSRFLGHESQRITYLNNKYKDI